MVDWHDSDADKLKSLLSIVLPGQCYQWKTRGEVQPVSVMEVAGWPVTETNEQAGKSWRHGG